MDCECKKLLEIQEFGGCSHYENTLHSMKKNIENGFFNIVSESSFEIIFKCKSCKQIWRMGIPDYPVQGYFF